MVTNLRESKARLSELVQRASQGEDVLITVRGKVKARLTAATKPDFDDDRSAWVEELAKLRKEHRGRGKGRSSNAILSELRRERL